MENLPATIEETGAEMASIEATMGTAAYRRDEAVQSRYLSLARHREALQGGEGAEPEEYPLQIASRAELAEVCPGADYDSYLQLNRRLGSIYVDTPPADRAALVSSFEGLPDSVVAAIVEEVMEATAAPGFDADDELFEEFRAGIGSVIVSEWGQNARYLWARTTSRLLRIAEGLNPGDQSCFIDWMASKSPGAAAAIYRGLAT